MEFRLDRAILADLGLDRDAAPGSAASDTGLGRDERAAAAQTGPSTTTRMSISSTVPAPIEAIESTSASYQAAASGACRWVIARPADVETYSQSPTVHTTFPCSWTQ